MLEKVKPGDFVILSNGEQARISRVNINPEGIYKLCFDRPVHGIIGVSRYDNWEYKQDGMLDSVPHKSSINIVKIIAE